MGYGQIQVKYTRYGLVSSYYIEVWHDGLSKHRVIRCTDENALIRKAEIQLEEWEEKWNRFNEREDIRNTRLEQKVQEQEKKDLAAFKTKEAEEEIEALRNILKIGIEANLVFDWESIKKRLDTCFDEPRPEIQLPPKPDLIVGRPAPRKEDYLNRFPLTPSFDFLSIFSASRRARLKSELNKKKLKLIASYQEDKKAWDQESSSICELNDAQNKQWNDSVSVIQEQYQKETIAWEARKATYLKVIEEKQAESDSQVNQLRELYFSKAPQAIEQYYELVLSRSEYPDYFPKEFELEYNNETKALVIDYNLPKPTDIPRVKAIKYIKSKDDFEEKFLSESGFNKLYDDILYQTILRTIYEVFAVDVIDEVQSVALNGIVTTVNSSTGNEITSCILSVYTTKKEFSTINLTNVDPKACFKSLKGVGSAKLSTLVPIPPVMNIKRDDRRFVASHDVADTLDNFTNIATMDWEDFEHLVREIFEKEFAGVGGEVRVTQASRDGGVDAVVFDPDPIRGGKIVIQAKRYTNIVGVSAVRDLYGTVMNEGANKGILVTTSDFGADSHTFAKGKPISLISGANLLSLLEKHGHRAKIDVHEAKRLQYNMTQSE